MASTSFQKFKEHMKDCSNTIEVFNLVKDNPHVQSEFILRYVWVAAISALDNYISDLVVEINTDILGRNGDFLPALTNETITFDECFDIHNASSLNEKVVKFNNILRAKMNRMTFQKPDDIAKGLSYVWNQKYKWSTIAAEMGEAEINLKQILSNICSRRNIIAHNADYNYATNLSNPCDVEDAIIVISFINRLVAAIDKVTVVNQ